MTDQASSLLIADAQRLHGMAEELGELPPPLTDADLVCEIEGCRSGLADLMRSDRLELRLVVMGGFSAGKSTLVNALIGRKVAAVAAEIKTAYIGVFRYGEEERAVFRYRDGSERELPLDIALGFLQGQDHNSDLFEQLAEVDFTINAPDLRGWVIVDTPGLGSVVQQHEDLMRREIEQCQAVLWVFNADRAGSATEREYLERLKGTTVVAALNKRDNLAAEEVKDVLAEARQAAPELLDQVLPVSAFEAWQARETGDEKLLEASGLPDLCRHIQERVFGREALVHEIGLRKIRDFQVRQLHRLIVARLTVVAELLRRARDLEGVLAQRRAVALQAIEDALLAANSAWCTERMADFDRVRHEHGGIRSAAEIAKKALDLLDKDVQRAHAQALLETARRVLSEQLQEMVGELQAALPERSVEVTLVVQNDRAGEAGRVKELILGGAAGGGLAGLAIAIATVGVTWPVSIPAAILGAGAGWMASLLRRGQAWDECQTALSSVLSEARTHWDNYVNEGILPTVEGHLDAQLEQLRAAHREAELGGRTIEEVEQSQQRLGDLQADLEAFARDRGITLTIETERRDEEQPDDDLG